jgi:hypothetical protein
MGLIINPPRFKLDKPHDPWGKHVDHITHIKGIGADKMRFGEKGEVLSHELILKGRKKINL